MKKEIYILAAMLFVLVGVISSVAAFGISTPYWTENPLIMKPGEIKDISFSLQNMVGTTDMAIRVALLEGQEIASLTDSSKDYLVKSGTADTIVGMRVIMPVTEAVGTKHTIILTFSTITSGVSSSVSVGSSIEKSFDVIAGGEIKGQGIESWMWPIAAVAIVLILVLLRRPKKKSKKRR